MIWDWVNLYHMFVSGLFCKPNPCFVLSCGIWVASKSNVDSIPFLIGVLIPRCKYQSFMIIEIVMSILFNRCVSLQVDPIISTSARSIITSSQRCLFHPSPSCFCFSYPPTLIFLQGLRFLNRVSILLMWSLSIIFLQCSYPVILKNILTKPQVHHSPFFSFNVLIRWFSWSF